MNVAPQFNNQVVRIIGTHEKNYLEKSTCLFVSIHYAIGED